MLPNILKNFNLFVNSVGYAGIVDEITPPKLTLKTEEHRAGGMDSPVEIDMGMEKLEMEFTLSNPVVEVIKQWGGNNSVPFTLRGALEGENGMTPIVINAQGMLREIDFGTWKAGEKVQKKVVVALRYFKYTQGEEVLVEIDAENMIRIIDGVDRLAEMRSALSI